MSVLFKKEYSLDYLCIPLVPQLEQTVVARELIHVQNERNQTRYVPKYH